MFRLPAGFKPLVFGHLRLKEEKEGELDHSFQIRRKQRDLLDRLYPWTDAHISILL